ncbi:MAG: hypothetical protein GY720_23920 [bacterium]|nr:hypothetical protein [bacterium]
MASDTKTEEAPLDEVETPDDVEQVDDSMEDPSTDALEEDPATADDDDWVESDDDDSDDETETTAADSDKEGTADLDELESEELEMLTEDELAETLVIDEAAEMAAIRRAELAMRGETSTERSTDEFVCKGCFLVLKTSQLVDKRRTLCSDCAG